MSCKKNKWWPHNWLCLGSLYWIFIGLFYVIFIFTLYNIVQMVQATLTNPAFKGPVFWQSLIYFIIQAGSLMIGFLAVAHILRALRKIVCAVAPCCCHENKKEEVVVTKSEK